MPPLSAVAIQLPVIRSMAPRASPTTLLLLLYGNRVSCLFSFLSYKLITCGDHGLPSSAVDPQHPASGQAQNTYSIAVSYMND